MLVGVNNVNVGGCEQYVRERNGSVTPKQTPWRKILGDEYFFSDVYQLARRGTLKATNFTESSSIFELASLPLSFCWTQIALNVAN